MNIQIVIYFSLFFFLSEIILMIAKRSKKKKSKKRNDRRSLLLFWIVIPLSLTIGFLTANYLTWNSFNKYLAIVGLIIFIIGIIVRWIAIIQLNKEFTVDVVITADHQLKTDGIYATIRHPSYLGLLLISVGLSMAMNSIISFLVITIPILFAIIYRITIEENILISEFGEKYIDYRKKTYKIIPKVY